MFCSLLSLSLRNQSHTLPALSSSIGHPSCSDITLSKFREDIYHTNIIKIHSLINYSPMTKLQEKRMVSTVKRHRKRSWVLNPDNSTKPASSSVKNVRLSLFFSPPLLHLTSLLCTLLFLSAIRLVCVCLCCIVVLELLNRNVVWRHDLWGCREIISFSFFLFHLANWVSLLRSEKSISIVFGTYLSLSFSFYFVWRRVMGISNNGPPICGLFFHPTWPIITWAFNTII